MDKELDVLLQAYRGVAAEIEAVENVVGPRQYTKLRELAVQIDVYVDEMLDGKKKLLTRIMEIPRQDYRDVLILRDIGGLRFSDISLEMRFSIRHVFRMYKSAREALDSIMP